MPYVDVDLDIDDIYRNCSDREKQELVDWLKEDGYLTERDTEYDKSASLLQQLFNKNIAKIKDSYLTMSKEDFEMINQIAKKY